MSKDKNKDKSKDKINREYKDKHKSKCKNKSQNYFSLFFSKWSFFGIIVILISIIIDLVFDECVIKQIFVDLFETIGIALVVGAVFDFAKNSAEFTTFVANILSDIVVSKSFLKRLSESDKKEALSMVLQPSDKQIELYSNINEYFNEKVNSSMMMFNTNFKSHTVLDITAKKENGKVVTKGTISYRIYRIQDRYEPIVVMFERYESEMLKRRIISPDGIKDFTIVKENDERMPEAGIDYKRITYEIPEELHKYQYLTIESEICEPGYDHWTNFNWTSLTPYDGLVLNLHCEDNLEVKEHVLFDEKSKYYVDLSKNRKKLKVTSSCWLDRLTGISITIAEK